MTRYERFRLDELERKFKYIDLQKIKKIEIPMDNRYSNLCVCLDAGHASVTPGKRSPYVLNGVGPELKFEEWRFNRDIVSKLADKLRNAGVDVYIVTPEDDVDVALSTRASRANKYIKDSGKKGIFISVHSNAAGNGSKWMTAKGWSAYTTVGQNNSDILADCLYDAAEKYFADRKVRTQSTDGDRDYEENFTVIYKANMPAVLTENFFYDNEDDCRYLLSDVGINNIVNVHYDGIISFANKFYMM